jgi:hypothetical protein
MKVSMAIATYDRPDIHHKEGDIIAIMPAGWQWGQEELRTYLILEMDLGLTIDTIEEARKLEVPFFEKGEIWWPDDIPKIIEKRRYKIPFTDLDTTAKSAGTTIDWAKVKTTISYQPLQTKTVPFTDLVYDKAAKSKLTDSDLGKIKAAGK